MQKGNPPQRVALMVQMGGREVLWVSLDVRTELEPEFIQRNRSAVVLVEVIEKHGDAGGLPSSKGRDRGKLRSGNQLVFTRDLLELGDAPRLDPRPGGCG